MSSNDPLKPISLPTLVDFDWRIDMISSSSSIDRMSVPTCLLQLKVDDEGQKEAGAGGRNVTVEMSKETLDTMLHGLGKIRDQLNSVASR